MQVATKSQVSKLVQNGDEKLAIACMRAASSVGEIMDNWGEMQDWEIEYATQKLRDLLEIVNG